MENKNDLLEWYESLEPEPKGIVIVKKSVEGEQPVNTCDLNNVPSESPQADIQKEIIQQAQDAQLTTKTDNVIVQDKFRIHKALGMIEVIKQKLIHVSLLSGADQNEPLKKEDLIGKIKMLVNDLSETVGAL